MTLVPTVNCNFACDYCYENSDIHSLSRKQGSTMSDEVCKSIIKVCEQRVTAESGLSIIWYGGEPLMARSVIKKLSAAFMELCAARGAKYNAGIITNGYLLTAKTLAFLVDVKVGFIQVTIDGPKDIHDSRRCLKSGGGTYDRILSNLECLEENTPLHVSLRVNVDRRNSPHVPRLLDDLKIRDLHCRKNVSIHFGQTVRYGNSCPDIASHCMGSDEFGGFMVEGFNRAVDLGFKVSSFPMRQTGSCAAVGTHSFLVDPSGDLQACWATVGNPKTAIGKLTSDGVQYYPNAAKWLGWTPFRTECEDCRVLPICMGGCPYKHLYKEEVPDRVDNICVWWKFNLSEMLQVAARAHKNGLLAVGRSPELRD